MLAPLARQEGIALIAALLLVALVTAIVSRLTFSNEIWLRQAENGSSLMYAMHVERVAQQWIALMLEQDIGDADGNTDVWAQQLLVVPVGQGSISGYVEDMQGKFNINNLITDNGRADPESLEHFTRLLQILGLDADIANAVIDWIDPDNLPLGVIGAESDYYLAQQPAYYAANRPLTSIDELRMVRGIDQHTWSVLRRYVVALPSVTPVNINTASAEVLAAVVTDWGRTPIAMGEARRWRSQIRQSQVESMDEFASRALLDTDSTDLNDLSVASHYFRAHIEIQHGRVRRFLGTNYYRNNGRAIVYQSQPEYVRVPQG